MELEAGNAEGACVLGFARNSALLTWEVKVQVSEVWHGKTWGHAVLPTQR